MGRIQRSRAMQVAMLAGGVAVAAALIFGSFGDEGGPLGTGVSKVMAQPSGTLAGRVGTIAPAMMGGFPESATPSQPTEAQLAARQAHMDKAHAAMAARVAALPASDSRVAASSALPLAPNTQTTSRPMPGNASAPNPQAPGDFTYFEANQLNGGAFFGTTSIQEPSVAQNGKYVFETWNWGAARSVNGGNTWAYINPTAGMADFCCDQDVIYDKGHDKMFWLRQGISGSFASPLGGVENRDLITVDNGAAALCTYDIRPSITGQAFYANSWFDYPRVSLSDKFLYVNTNVFTNAGAFLTSFLIRFDLEAMSNCATAGFTFWGGVPLSEGWNPTAVENAREIMYMGDQIVTNTGLNDQFRVYWIFDDNTTLNYVNRTIAPYLFTNRNTANCPVPGGFNPCARADQRITGAVLSHNTPLPGGLGAAGDKIDFFWNVREGNGFPVPYVESAGFQGNTINYVQRKLIWNTGFSFWYAAVGANDRSHVGLSVMEFWPTASGVNPRHSVGLDDDYNGNAPGWELYNAFNSTAAWTASSSGDYLRVRSHNPVGTAWAAVGSSRQGAAYAPSYLVFGRSRDLAGFNRFDQQ